MNRAVKKVLSLISASAIMCTAFINASAVPGDADNNYWVNSFDAQEILCYVVGKPYSDSFNYYEADYNGDGVIDSTDALCVLEYSVEIRKNKTLYNKEETVNFFNEALSDSCKKAKNITEKGSASFAVYGLGEDIHECEPIENSIVFKNGKDADGNTALELFSSLWDFELQDVDFAVVCYPEKSYQADVRLRNEEISLDEALKNPDEYDMDLSFLEDEGIEVLSGSVKTAGPYYTATIQKNSLAESLYIYQQVTETLHVRYENEEFDVIIETTLDYSLYFNY